MPPAPPPFLSFLVSRLLRAAALLGRSYARGMASLPAMAAAPHFSLGLIADVQYCDIPDGSSFDGSETRYYRGSLALAAAAAADFEAAGCSVVVQCGDLIDGKCNPEAAAAGPPLAPCSENSLAMLQRALGALGGGYDLLHVRGNHESYNASIAEQRALLPLPAGASFFASDLFAYSYSPHPSWRFIVLDGYDVSLARARGSAEFAAAQALLRAHNPNACAHGDEGAPRGDFFAGLKGSLSARFVPFNGAVGARQLAWLAEQLAAARGAAQRVVVFSHIPLAAGNKAVRGEIFSTLLWNFAEVNAVLEPFAATVAAVVSGHNHSGSWGREGGILHLTLPSPLLFPQGSHLIMRLFADRLELAPFGEVRTLVEALGLPTDIPLAPLPAAQRE